MAPHSTTLFRLRGAIQTAKENGKIRLKFPKLGVGGRPSRENSSQVPQLTVLSSQEGRGTWLTITRLALETLQISLCGQMQYKENHLSEKLNLKIGFKILFNITPGILIEACVSTKSWFGKYPGLCCCIGPECKLWSKGRSKPGKFRHDLCPERNHGSQ